MAETTVNMAMFDNGRRAKPWTPKRFECTVPLKFARLCLLGMLLPAILVAGPVYLRYKVYSDQLYPLAATDQRLIDGKISTTWCQRQVVKVNTTFNAYLIGGEPEMKVEPTPVSMTRHLVLEDDMKEYWGFYLLKGSSVTVSTCVRWPGASLTIIRGHRHLHECAFIGDDSTEELEELLEIAEEKGLYNASGYPLNVKEDNPSNTPARMKKARQGVEFHHKGHAPASEDTMPALMSSHHYTSHELDAKAMRTILTNLFAKTLVTKKKQQQAHHHYEGVYRESDNIEKPPIVRPDELLWRLETVEKLFGVTKPPIEPLTKTINKIENSEISEENLISTTEQNFPEILTENVNKISAENFSEILTENVSELSTQNFSEILTENVSEISTQNVSELSPISSPKETSSELLDEVLKKIEALGDKGQRILKKLSETYKNSEKDEKSVKNLLKDEKSVKNKVKRQVFLSSPSLATELTEDAEDEDAAVEKEDLHPDGIAEDRGTVNETTMNDRSNSEFWSSFSSSEERLLECKGLILNLPLTPHHQCSPKHETEHVKASIANTITYRVPVDGYYFFVFNSENEIQPNYLRVKFDLVKTYYNTSNPIHACKNSTGECALPFNFFSWERTVLELPFSGNDSQWNEEYVVVSQCEPRTAVYLLCMISVPLLILLFAFQ